MKRHVALVVWALPGVVSPFVHAAVGHTEADVMREAYQFAYKAQLGAYRCFYLGEIMGERMDLIKPQLFPGPEKDDEIDASWQAKRDTAAARRAEWYEQADRDMERLAGEDLSGEEDEWHDKRGDDHESNCGGSCER